MFLIRWGFWVAVVVMLLPTDRAQQERLLKQASAATHWTMTFCERNPTTCTRAGEVWTVFQSKAQFAFAMASDIVSERLKASGSRADLTASATGEPGRGPGAIDAGLASSPASRLDPRVAPSLAATPGVRGPAQATSPSPVFGSAPARGLEDQVLIRPVKPQDRLPLYPQQSRYGARTDG